jgi:hypothetical protein
MRLHFRSLARTVLAVTAFAALAACDDDDPSGPSNTGRVRAVNAVSNLAAVDVLLNTTSYKTNLAFKTSDGYRSFATGTTSVKFRKAGVATDLITANQNIANATDYTVFAAGTEAAPQSFVLNDNNALPAAGKVKFRAVHAAIGAGAVDVYILANANELANATPAKANLTEKSASDYIIRDAGTYVVIMTTTGTKTPVLTINAVQVAAGKIRTIAVVEKAGGGAPLEGVVLTDN